MGIKQLFALGLVSATLGLSACGSQEAAAAASDDGEIAAAPAGIEAAAHAGNVVEVKMVTDGARNYFEPQNVKVSRGDVVRFVLVSGVHNASFPAASNAGASALPAATPYLQQPGQTHDVAIDVPAGEYTFQCDPHAVLGMVGTLTVD